MTKEEGAGRKAQTVNGWIGDTDDEWFAFLARRPGIEEVGFWRAGGKTVFEAPMPGETFRFKPCAPQNYRASDTLFTQRSIMGVSLSCEGLGEEGREGGSEHLGDLQGNRGGWPSATAETALKAWVAHVAVAAKYGCGIPPGAHPIRSYPINRGRLITASFILGPDYARKLPHNPDQFSAGRSGWKKLAKDSSRYRKAKILNPQKWFGGGGGNRTPVRKPSA